MKSVIEIRVDHPDDPDQQVDTTIVAFTQHPYFPKEILASDPFTMVKTATLGLLSLIRNLEADGTYENGEAMKYVIANLNEGYMDHTAEPSKHRADHKTGNKIEASDG